MKSNKIQQITLIIFVFYIVNGCTKIIEIKIPEQEPKLVLNGFFTNDSIFKVNVSQTTNFNETDMKFISDASIELFSENGLKISEFDYLGNGIYKSKTNYKPLINKEYFIEVKKPGFEKIKAKNIIPYPPEVIRIIKQDSALINEDGDYMSEVEITINDNGNRDNWYEFELLGYYFPDYSDVSNFWNPNDTIWETRQLFITSNDIVFTNEGLSDYYPEAYPVSDTLFNGLTYSVKIQYMPPQDVLIINENEYNLAKNYYLIVVVRAISKDYYEFKKKLIIHLENQSGDIWDGIASPVQLYSNVTGAYGIFAGYSSFVDTIR